MKAMLVAFCLILLGWDGVPANATPVVHVLDVYPAGQSVALPSNKNFYLRLAYETDKPMGIWVTPYYRGRKVSAGTSPSATYSGTGEALAWFFLSDPGLRVDEIRIKAGDGGYDMPVVGAYHVDVTAGNHPAVASNSPWAPEEPQWVVSLREKSNKQFEAAASTSQASGGAAPVLLGGFMVAVAALGIAGLAAPVWAMLRWEGGWRLAAGAPLGLLGFVILRIALETSVDPTSHNLWPFEILMASFASLGIIVLFAVIRRARRRV